MKAVITGMTPIIALLLNSVYLAGCSDDVLSDDTLIEDNIRAVEHFTIGLTEEDFLGQPVDVVTDSEGRIYIADQSGSEIRVFSPEGEFLQAIGRRGGGPGELDRPTTLYMLPDDRLLVTDHGSRRITEFEPGGSHRQIWSMAWAQDRWLPPSNMVRLEENSFVAEGRLQGIESDERAERQLHVIRLGEEALHVENSFFSLESELGELSALHEHLISLTGGSLLLKNDGVLLYSPYPYSGDLFVLGRSDDDSSWHVQDRWTGYTETAAAFDEVDPDRVRDDEPSLFSFVWIGSEGRESATGILHNTSRGLYQLDSAHIVHFTEIRHKGERTLGVELFDAAGNLQGYRALPDLAVEGYGRTPAVAWQDDWDRFYIVTTTPEDEGGIPIVRVVSLETEADEAS